MCHFFFEARACRSYILYTEKYLREYKKQKICYENTGNVPYKGRNFNTQTFGKMYLFVICMISRQTKLLLYIA